jgi:hypothetical protein
MEASVYARERCLVLIMFPGRAGERSNMVKAVFHKNQRVFVTPVGTWASIERVVPQWVKGIDEPFRVHYDCGLGRPFEASELTPEKIVPAANELQHENWRVFRAQNRWQSLEDSAHHPLPGTHPVVVTGDDARHGWRVPATEYDAAPSRFETQARTIAAAPRLVSVIKALIEIAEEHHSELPYALLEQAQNARKILNDIENVAASLGHGALEDPIVESAVEVAPLPQPGMLAARSERPKSSAPARVFGRDDAAKPAAYMSPALRPGPTTR